MGRWLDRVENSGNAPGSIPTEPTKLGFVSSVSTPAGGIPQNRESSVGSVSLPTGAFTEIDGEEVPDSHDNWLQWIDNELPLLREDREYVFSRLLTLPPGGMEAVARRYVQRWQEAAAAEPKPHRKENVGRRAANQSLLYLVKPGSWRWQRKHREP